MLARQLILNTSASRVTQDSYSTEAALQLPSGGGLSRTLQVLTRTASLRLLTDITGATFSRIPTDGMTFLQEKEEKDLAEAGRSDQESSGESRDAILVPRKVRELSTGSRESPLLFPSALALKLVLTRATTGNGSRRSVVSKTTMVLASAMSE